MDATPILLALAALAVFWYAARAARKEREHLADERRRLIADENRVHERLYGRRWRNGMPPRMPRR